MKIIAHRGKWTSPDQQNSLASLEHAFQAGYGVETDLRSFQGNVYISHDAVNSPQGLVSFEEFMALAERYPERMCFLNIKEDGLCRILEPYRQTLLAPRFVFFDMSVPQLIQFSRHYRPFNLATRQSEFETVPSAPELVEWIWADCFTRDWSQREMTQTLGQSNKQICFVSPELHGRGNNGFRHSLRSALTATYNTVAVCTDEPDRYAEEFGND